MTATLTIPSAAAILRDGGATFRPNGTPAPITGYAVSLPDAELVVLVGTFTDDTLRRYVDKWAHRLERFPNLFVGVWEAEGFVYLDLSQVVTSRAGALATARVRRQLAVYDFSTGETIPTAA